MALSASTLWEVRTTGDDTNGAGAFDPSKVSAGGFADGAATAANTSAPVFTSASYNFTANDVSAWLYIDSGTSWIPGWYFITSVASNAATLSAAIGAGVLAGNASMSTVVGCATVASPTAAKWTIDYSQQAAALQTYADLASAGTGLTVSSALKPFAKQQVGNAIVVTGGTNFNAGRYVIVSISGVTATVVGPTNITTGVGATGTGGLGGALASPGKAAGFVVNNNYAFIKNGTYAITSATGNVAGGVFSGFGVACAFIGYGSNRTMGNVDTKPLLQYQAGLSTATFSASDFGFVNLAFDGNTQTAAKLASNAKLFWRCTFTGFNTASAGFSALECTATANSATMFAGPCVACEAYANTASPFNAAGLNAVNCLSYNNTGASTDGFVGGWQVNCVAYGNGRHGFNGPGGAANCHAEANTGAGYSTNSSTVVLRTCSGYNNTGGLVTASSVTLQQGTVTVTAGSVFTNAGSSDFSLNTTALRGALLRAAGVPGVFPRGLTTGAVDIGAAQHADPAQAFRGFLLQ